MPEIYVCLPISIDVLGYACIRTAVQGVLTSFSYSKRLFTLLLLAFCDLVPNRQRWHEGTIPISRGPLNHMRDCSQLASVLLINNSTICAILLDWRVVILAYLKRSHLLLNSDQ